MERRYEDFDKDECFDASLSDSTSSIGGSCCDGKKTSAKSGAVASPKASDKAVAMKTNRANDDKDFNFDDPVHAYFTQMGDIPKLTREEELSAAMEIERSRRAYRRALFSLDFIVRESIELLEKIRANKVRLDRSIDVSVSDLEAKKHIQGLLDPSISTLRKILSRNRSEFTRITSGSVSREERRKLIKKIRRRRLRAVRILAELKLRTESVQPFLLKLIERLRESRALARRANELSAALVHAPKEPSAKRLRREFEALRKAWRANASGINETPRDCDGDVELSLSPTSVEYREPCKVAAQREDARDWNAMREELASLRQALRHARLLWNESSAAVERKIKRALERRQSFEKARCKLSSGNLRLVVSIAKKYRNRGLEYQDLIGEGNTGLMHAVDKFNYHLGYKFSTYGTWWVRQSMSKAVADQTNPVRLPSHLRSTIKKVHRATYELSVDNFCAPTPQEIAEATGLAVSDVMLAQRASRQPLSLDRPLEGYDDAFFCDFIEDSNGSDPVDEITRSALRECLEKALQRLPFREREIVRLRYGFVDGYCYTLEDVGCYFGITRERIRQLEARAVRKLQHPVSARTLSGFLDGNDRVPERASRAVKRPQQREHVAPPLSASAASAGIRSSIPIAR